MTTKEPASQKDRYAPLQREYAANARDYNRRWKRYIAASVGETLTRVRPEPGTRLLDVGCGTGELLVQLADMQPSAGYIGTDLSARMLNIARDRLDPSTDLFQAAIEALPLADDSIDVLTSTSVFHFVREPQKALSEMRRVLRPGGRLILTDWCRDFLTMRMLDSYLKTFDAAHHHSYGSGEFARLLEKHGFGGIHVSRYRINWFWGLFTATANCPKENAMTRIIHQSTLTCPICDHRKTETMPTDACWYLYDCQGCGAILRPKHGDCCVFCSYGDVPCPPVQDDRTCCTHSGPDFSSGEKP